MHHNFETTSYPRLHKYHGSYPSLSCPCMTTHTQSRVNAATHLSSLCSLRFRRMSGADASAATEEWEAANLALSVTPTVSTIIIVFVIFSTYSLLHYCYTNFSQSPFSSSCCSCPVLWIWSTHTVYIIYDLETKPKQTHQYIGKILVRLTDTYLWKTTTVKEIKEAQYDNIWNR